MFADFRMQSEIKTLEQKIGKYFDIKRQENITRNVVTALKLTSDQKSDMIARFCPFFLRNMMKDFCAVVGSRVFKQFVSRERVYFVYALQKKNLSA